jgi:hypothetical protein
MGRMTGLRQRTMTSRFTPVFIGILLVIAFSRQTTPQAPPNVDTVLRNISTRFPELTLIDVQQDQIPYVSNTLDRKSVPIR